MTRPEENMQRRPTGDSANPWEFVFSEPGHPDRPPTPAELKAHRKAVIATLAKVEELPEAPDLYFSSPPGAIDVPLESLRNIRARQKGIVNAEKYMAACARGLIPRRKPVSLHANADGTYTILDGNSTYAIAKKHGWASLRGVVVD